MKTKKMHILQTLVGAISIVLLLALFLGIILIPKRMHKKTESPAPPQTIGSITLDSEEITYDGQGDLQLLSGVFADDGKGQDVTKSLSVSILPQSLLNRKTIRYTFQDANGQTVQKKRTLILKQYMGPSIRAKSGSKINAKDVPNLIAVLQANGILQAQDGFQNDITEQVKCVREKLYSNVYAMEFSVVNRYGDTAKQRAEMIIAGTLADPLLKLYDKNVALSLGASFEPLSFVETAFDGKGENMDAVSVDSNVRTDKAGAYSVVYTIYNANHTAKSTQKLSVRVLEK